MMRLTKAIAAASRSRDFPSQKYIQTETERLRRQWDAKERQMRKLRARMACHYGVCRNH